MKILRSVAGSLGRLVAGTFRGLLMLLEGAQPESWLHLLGKFFTVSRR